MKRIRYFLETSVVRTVAAVLPRLPRSFILRMAEAVGALGYWFDFRGRATALENLRVTFATTHSDSQRRTIARRCYQNFARTFLDLFWAKALTPENWQRHVEIELDDPSAETHAHETGAVWVTPHFGNFEFVSLIWGYRNFDFTIVAQDFKNPGLTEIFRRLRQHSGHHVISQEGAMLKLAKALKRKGHAALLTDLNIKPSRSAAVIQCFGRPTCVPTLHVTLAQRFGLSIITGVCIPRPDGTYLVKIFEAIQPTPTDSVVEIAQRIWIPFERAILEHPDCWMWMYKHWRYLPSQERDPTFPDYANPSTPFRKLIEAQKKAKP